MKTLYFQEEFPKTCKLDVEVEVGSVAVKAHNGRYITVDVEFEEMEIDVYRQGNTFFVKAENKNNKDDVTSWVQKLFLWNNAKAHFKINVPEDCEVVVNTTTGKTTIAAVNAPVTVRTTTGATELANIGGAIYAKTTTGRLTYDGILTDDDHRFETTTGSIELNLHKEPNAMIDASTTTGRLSVDFPLHKQSENRNLTGGRIKGMLGSGNGRIKAKMTTGSLSISKA